MASMIGLVFVGQRVYVIQVPPSGNFIVGALVYGNRFDLPAENRSNCCRKQHNYRQHPQHAASDKNKMQCQNEQRRCSRYVRTDRWKHRRELLLTGTCNRTLLLRRLHILVPWATP